MPQFSSVREAKEFLVAKIVEESGRENVTLSEIEEKMLYFSETGWTLPDIRDVNEAFDRKYDQAQYEDKVATLIQSFRKFAAQHSSSDLNSWNEAMRVLRSEDHYLLVMIDIASLSIRPLERGANGNNRLGKLVLIGVVTFLVFVVFFEVYTRFVQYR